MPRRARIADVGLTYHVWANGVKSMALFRDDDDRDFAVELLRETIALCDWTCLEYVVMTTHYHVLLQLPSPTLTRGFHHFNLRYARYFNKRYEKRGHVFDARFQSKVVEGGFGQLETARYLARNPVKARICELPEQYPWCGYGTTIGLFRDDRIVDIAAALAPIGTRASYRTYVDESDRRARWSQFVARRRSVKPTRTRAAAR